MTDRDLDALLTALERGEGQARAAADAAGEDQAERDAAIVTVRLIVPVRQAITRWITIRARCAARQE